MASKTDRAGCALVLPGAVAKGAFEAGVIGVLADREIPITRVIGTSSGALNAVAIAAGIRIGRPKEVAERLIQAWIHFGSWQKAFHFNPMDWFRGKGFSDNKGLKTLLREMVPPAGGKGVNDIQLRIIIASLNGLEGMIGKVPSTTYEKVMEFTGEDFDTEEGLERIFEATVAACAFPGLFAPSHVEGLGPCFDGGTVNNAPIEYALWDQDIDRIVVAVPFPILVPPPENLHGLQLVNHIAEILINERLYRDLKHADALNQRVRALDDLVVSEVLSPEQLKAVKSVLPYRPIKVTQIRPKKVLEGGVFSGFTDQSVREKFIEEGRKAALEALSDPDGPLTN